MKKKIFRVTIVWLLFFLAASFVCAGGKSEKQEGQTNDGNSDGPSEEAPFQEDVETSTATTDDQFENRFATTTEVRYAEGFTIEYHNTYKLVRVLKPYPGAVEAFSYILVQRGFPVPNGYPDALVIEVPVQSFVSLSSTYIGCLSLLGELAKISGIDDRENIYNQEIRNRVDSYQVLEVAAENRPNIELLLEMEPDCIMTSAMGNEYDVHPKMAEVNLPVVINSDWNEATPLGRAEWIKFIAAFFNHEEKAKTIFDTIEKQYTTIRDAAMKTDTRPTVFANTPWQGTWYVPGGKSHFAALFADAGADYIWKETLATGSLALSFETVFYKADNGDVWLNAGWGIDSLDDLIESDERLSNFKAYKTGRVYSNNKRVREEGGNDFWESGVVNPQVILADLVKILHPELLPNHELYYYRKLE